MNKVTGFALLAVAAALGAAGWVALRPDPRPASPPQAAGGAMVAVTLPASLSAEAETGARIFGQVCAACHGQNAAGVEGSGPPLVHRIYEPSHHGDEAFQLAVARGVSAHHWRFGNMPPVAGLTRGDVAMVVAYVRALQEANGIR